MSKALGTAVADEGQKMKRATSGDAVVVTAVVASAVDADAASAGLVAGRTSTYRQLTTQQAWFEGRLPSDWFTSVDVTVDREEITVIGTLADETADEGAAAEGRISRFRADTRAQRIEIAEEAQGRHRCKKGWGAPRNWADTST